MEINEYIVTLINWSQAKKNFIFGIYLSLGFEPDFWKYLSDLQK